MAIILPALAFLLLWYLASMVSEVSPGRDWRHAFLQAFVLWGALLTLFTETLSIIRAVSLGSVAVAWAAACGALLCVDLLLLRRGARPSFRWPDLDRSAKLFSLCIFLVGLFLLLTALWVPPVTYDSMTYHLPRVEHWIQNLSVAHFPTNNLRQLYSGPFAEYAILHAELLTGGDYLANTIQWLAWLGTVIGISALTKELGGKRRAQLLAAVIAGTIPIGMLEAATTQNDLVVALWLVCTFYFGVIAIRSNDPVAILGMGLGLGLALLTKATAYLCALPLLGWLALASWRTGPKRLGRNLGLILVLALLINLGFLLRNQRLFGNPLGTGEFAGNNRAISLEILASTALRNAALELATPFPAINTRLRKAVIFVHRRWLGLDPSDPRSTFPGSRFRIGGDFLSEGVAGNPLHVALTVAAVVLWAAQPRLRRAKVLGIYLAVLGTGILLFCALLMWQPWGTRLHLPWLILLAAFEGIVFSETSSKPIAEGLAVVLVVSALPYLLFAKDVPLLSAVPTARASRSAGMFAHRRAWEVSYVGAANQIMDSGCSRVGLLLGEDTWEYPLWSLTRHYRRSHDLKFYSLVTITSPPFPASVNESLPPLCLVVTSFTGDQRLILGEQEYATAWSSPALVIMTPR